MASLHDRIESLEHKREIFDQKIRRERRVVVRHEPAARRVEFQQPVQRLRKAARALRQPLRRAPRRRRERDARLLRLQNLH